MFWSNNNKPRRISYEERFAANREAVEEARIFLEEGLIMQQDDFNTHALTQLQKARELGEAGNHVAAQIAMRNAQRNRFMALLIQQDRCASQALSERDVAAMQEIATQVQHMLTAPALPTQVPPSAERMKLSRKDDKTKPAPVNRQPPEGGVEETHEEPQPPRQGPRPQEQPFRRNGQIPQVPSN